MNYIIHYDICALVLTVLLSFCFFYKKYIPNLQNRSFLALLYMVMATTIVDLLDVYGTTFPERVPTYYLYITSYLFFFFLNVLPAAYAFYIVALTGTEWRLTRLTTALPFFIPLVTLVVILAGNPIFNWLFYYDSAMGYHRGPALYVLYFCAFYYLAFGLYSLYRDRDMVRPAKRAALFSFVPLVAIPSLIQIFIPTLLIEMLGASICMMLTLMTIQNPDELLNGQTGLFNRRAFLQESRHAYHQGKGFYVIAARLLKYDYLVRTFGDEQVTAILREIAGELRQLPVRHKQLFYLKDGIFTITMPENEIYLTLPEKVLSIVEGSSRENQMELTLSSRIHVIRCPDDADSVDSLVDYITYASNSDKGKTKEKGIVYVSSEFRNVHARVLAVERAVERALATNGFEVYYQPIFSVKENRVNSAEALLRLRDPELGFIPPDEFIPITEKSGKIIEIGMFVFRTVCQFIAKNDLKKIGIDYIEINLSVEQCMQHKLADQLLRTIDEFHLPTSCINLEITETAVAYSTEILETNMNTLAETGIKFSLDDYGTGYSNMASMVHLPFNLVKIDKGIVSSLEDERVFIAISSTIAMFREMRMGIVAEGVETYEQVEVLSALGCDYLQGYFYSRPVCATEFLEKCIELRDHPELIHPDPMAMDHGLLAVTAAH